FAVGVNSDGQFKPSLAEAHGSRTGNPAGAVGTRRLHGPGGARGSASPGWHGLHDRVEAAANHARQGTGGARRIPACACRSGGGQQGADAEEVPLGHPAARVRRVAIAPAAAGAGCPQGKPRRVAGNPCASEPARQGSGQMNALAALSIGVSAVGWCLLHFVWQAAAIGAVYALARGALPRGNPRYLAAMLALVAMAVCPVATGVHEFSLATAPIELADLAVTPASGVAAASAATAIPAWQLLLGRALPWLVLTWALGAAALGVRVYRQWHGLRRMLAAAEQLPQWQSRARQFAQCLGLRRMVPVLASVRVATPTLIGWIKPVVVLPLAVLAQMPPAQIDLVLAHELAHLKRLDHIANLFQLVLETLFFYHPVVHWISREARNERELCCDTLALQVTGGERRDFVAALANLEEFRAGHAGLALAASGGVLAERAWFIAGAVPKRPQRHLRSHAIVMAVVLALAGTGWTWWRDTAWQQRTAALVAANDASILHFAVQELRVSASLPPSHAAAKPVLPPVDYPVLRVSDNEASLPAAS